MPCDQVIKLTLNIKAMNRPLLKRGLEREGWQVAEHRGVLYAAKEGQRIEIGETKAVVRDGEQDLLDKVYNAYTKELVRTTAAKFGAKLTPTNNANQWKMTLPQFSKSSF